MRTITVNPISYKINNSGRVRRVWPMTIRLLLLFGTNIDRVWTREDILSSLGLFAGKRTVDVHIRRLRVDLEDEGCAIVECIVDKGYKFNNNYTIIITGVDNEERQSEGEVTPTRWGVAGRYH